MDIKIMHTHSLQVTNNFTTWNRGWATFWPQQKWSSWAHSLCVWYEHSLNQQDKLTTHFFKVFCQNTATVMYLYNNTAYYLTWVLFPGTFVSSAKAAVIKMWWRDRQMNRQQRVIALSVSLLMQLTQKQKVNRKSLL